MFPSPKLKPPELEDFQWEFNGLTFGAGTATAVLKAEGFDLASIRSGDVSWPRDHGQALGLDLFEGRDIIFDLWMKSDGTSLQSSQLALAAATTVLPNKELPLWFKLPNLELMCIMCRPRKKKLTIDANYAAANLTEPELVLHATDPRIYEAGKESTLALQEPPATPTVVELTNGNTEMRPIVIFNGPLAAPKIANASITSKPFIELIDPAMRVKREEAEAAVRAEREKTEATERHEWLEQERFLHTITKKEREEKEAAQKVEREEAEAAEKTAREAAETKEAEERSKGEIITVKEGDQVLVDLGTPHRILYYSGGIKSESAPINIAAWLTSGSSWWDLLPELNKVEFTSGDGAKTSGTAVIEWAPANEL